MEIREVTQYHEKSPFTGYGIWIVFELKYRKAQLLHPIYLTELMMSEYELVKASGNCLWPVQSENNFFNMDRFRKNFKERVEFFIQQKKSFPVNSVAKVIAELDGSTEQEALAWIGSKAKVEEGRPTPMIFSKGTIQYLVNPDFKKHIGGRKGIIVDAVREHGPASIYQLTHLVEGRLKTVTELSRVVTYLVHNLQDQRILIPSIGEDMSEHVHTHDSAAVATEIATEKPKKTKTKVGDKAEATTVVEKREKAVRTPRNITYRILNGVDVTKFSGQRAAVVRALQKLDSENSGTPVTVDQIVANVEGLVSKTPVEASVRYHLAGLVKDQQVEANNVEAPAASTSETVAA